MTSSGFTQNLRLLMRVCGFALVTTAITILFLGLAGIAYAQDGAGVTPTPAPTKTPGAPTSDATEDTTSGPSFRPLTQADLRVLTGNVQRPNGIVYHDGHLYVSCSGDWTLYRLDADSGQTITYIYGIRNSHTMFAETGEDEEVHLWVPDYQTNSLSHVTRNGVQNVADNLNGPWGIAYWNDQTFLVTNLLGNSVTQITRDGDVEDLITGLMSPTGIVVDGERLYVGNNGSTRRAIEWYDLTAPRPIDASGPPDAARVLVTGLQNTTGLTMGPDGYLYFSYSLGTRGVVGRVQPDECLANGGCTHDQVEIVVLTELAGPLAGLTVTPDNRLYLHTMFSPEIYWAQLPGTTAPEATESA